MVFLHPLPHDLTAWTYQTASFSRWYRTVAIDLPGHGRSPRSPGSSLGDVARACWETVGAAVGAGPIVLVGLSVGSVVAKYMVHQRPTDISALVLTGGGYHEGAKGIAARHVSAYRERGAEHRREHLAANFSAAFSETDIARWFIDLALSRHATGDVGGTIDLLEALDPADPEWLHAGITVPTLIVAGSEDRSLPAQEELHRRVAGSKLHVIRGAGHCCNIERPGEYDVVVRAFLDARELTG